MCKVKVASGRGGEGGAAASEEGEIRGETGGKDARREEGGGLEARVGDTSMHSAPKIETGLKSLEEQRRRSETASQSNDERMAEEEKEKESATTIHSEDSSDENASSKHDDAHAGRTSEEDDDEDERAACDASVSSSSNNNNSNNSQDDASARVGGAMSTSEMLRRQRRRARQRQNAKIGKTVRRFVNCMGLEQAPYRSAMVITCQRELVKFLDFVFAPANVINQNILTLGQERPIEDLLRVKEIEALLVAISASDPPTQIALLVEALHSSTTLESRAVCVDDDTVAYLVRLRETFAPLVGSAFAPLTTSAYFSSSCMSGAGKSTRKLESVSSASSYSSSSSSSSLAPASPPPPPPSGVSAVTSGSNCRPPSFHPHSRLQAGVTPPAAATIYSSTNDDNCGAFSSYAFPYVATNGFRPPMRVPGAMSLSQPLYQQYVAVCGNCAAPVNLYTGTRFCTGCGLMLQMP